MMNETSGLADCVVAHDQLAMIGGKMCSQPTRCVAFVMIGLVETDGMSHHGAGCVSAHGSDDSR